MPTLVASSWPRAKTFILHLNKKIIVIPIITIGSKINTLEYVDEENDPSSQKVISANCLSDVAKYLNNPVDELINPPTITPARSKKTDDGLRNTFEIINVKNIVNNPKIKENPLTTNPVNPNTIANAAPTLAPDDTPNKSGETNLLLNISWYTSPETDKAIPVSSAIIVLGILKFIIMFLSIAGASLFPVIIFIKLSKVIVYLPTIMATKNKITSNNEEIIIYRAVLFLLIILFNCY